MFLCGDLQLLLHYSYIYIYYLNSLQTNKQISNSLSAQARASTGTYNEFQSLKTGVLQQSAEIVRESETMLELMRLMRETCAHAALDKPAKHIQVRCSSARLFQEFDSLLMTYPNNLQADLFLFVLYL